MNIILSVPDVAQMEATGAALARRLSAGSTVYVRGPLGAGKTTFVRGLLHALGHAGTVKSPTFTLVESYTFDQFSLYHFDLYRLKDPQELEFMGLRDYLKGDGVCVIEWPERGAGVLPSPDVDVMIEPTNSGRNVVFSADNERGAVILQALRA